MPCMSGREAVTDEELAEVAALDRALDPQGTWTNSDGKRKPGKSIFIAETAREEEDVDGTGRPSRYGPTRAYVCNAFSVVDAHAIVRFRTLAPRLAREVRHLRAVSGAWKLLALALIATRARGNAPEVLRAIDELEQMGERVPAVVRLP